MATAKEKTQLTASRARGVAQAGSDVLSVGVGGYLAGRFARNSVIAGYPLPLVAGAAALFMRRKYKSGWSRRGVYGAVGAGAYGAGKLGEEHGEKAGNDGNIFSWSKSKGVYTD